MLCLLAEHLPRGAKQSLMHTCSHGIRQSHRLRYLVGSSSKVHHNPTRHSCRSETTRSRVTTCNAEFVSVLKQNPESEAGEDNTSPRQLCARALIAVHKNASHGVQETKILCQSSHKLHAGTNGKTIRVVHVTS